MPLPSKQVFFIALALLAGVGIGALTATNMLTSAFPSHWFTLVPPTSDSSVPTGNSVDVGTGPSISYSSSVIIDSDIAPPEVTALSGRAKFLSYNSENADPTAIGYVISVSTDSLDMARLPEKYKTERIIQTKQGPLTILPLEEATYEVYFVLSLLDRDGFELLAANSPKHNIRSGTTNQLQGQTDSLITSRFAAQTDKITLHMVVKKCLSAKN